MNFISRTPVPRGWSCDRKYRAVTADGQSYLLRVTPPENAASRALMFRMQQAVAALGVPMCDPIEIRECGDEVETVHRWIEGVDAEDAIPDFPVPRQYEYGLEAGRILRLIHSVPAPTDQPDWETRFNAKIDRKIKLCRECSIQFDGAEEIIRYINSHRYLLKNRPQSFQHGDYHIGNMMLEGDRLTVIDFDRFDFGDPWEEFNRIVWCVKASPPFASGMVDGYFDGEIPTVFWELLALYMGSNQLSSVPWAIPFGEGEIKTMLDLSREMLSWYRNMSITVPLWYCGKKNVTVTTDGGRL